MVPISPEYRDAQRAALKRIRRPLKTKIRRGETLTADEQATWDETGKRLNRLGGTRSGPYLTAQKPYDSTSGASSRRGGPSVTQGPAGGVSSVVRGGLPGLGKRT